jgi:hypothetical protein
MEAIEKIVIIHPENKKGNPYKPEFVKKILQGDEYLKNGKRLLLMN